MGRLRARLALLSLAFASILVFVTHGQEPAARRLDIVPNLGLPAVEQSIDMTRVQTSSAATLRDSIQRSRAGGDTDYVPGRVIVKFREQASANERAVAVRDAIGEPSAFIAERPAYANFDVVRIDTADDAETTAMALGFETAVE